MAEDFYSQSARMQWDALEAQRMRSLADLHAAKASGDTDAAAAAIMEIANVEAGKTALNALHTQYQASQNPPAPPPLSRDERMAKPLDRMDYHDALEVARTSRYGKSLDHNDPLIQAGYREVQRRRGRGE